jgi:hypothetical protein
MSYDELLLECLRKKYISDPSDPASLQNSDQFTTLFTAKSYPSNELENTEKLREKQADPLEWGKIMTLEEQLNQLNYKFPFFHFKSFLDDYFDGVFKSKIVENYQLTSVKDVKEIVNILELPKRKEKIKFNDISGHAKITNLKNHHAIYDEFNENYNLFKHEIDIVYFSNILKSKIILEVIKGNDDKEKLNKKNICTFKEFNFLNNLFSKTLSDNAEDLTFIQLEKYFDSNLDQILEKLISEDVVQNKDNKLVLNNSLTESKLNNLIIAQIASEEKGCSFKEILELVSGEFPYFTHLPHFSILRATLENFESEHKVKIQEESNKKNGFTERHFFSSVFYKKQIKFSKKIEKNQYGRKIFFGRPNISGIEFVYELERLVKGELDDVDDQVTRIAGLILATNQKITTSVKSNTLFEISTDVIHYEPTPEEEKLMGELNFVLKPETEVMHLKILIDEKITKNLLEKLSNFINTPDGTNSQIIIVSFENNDDVLNLLPTDHSIQIVDKTQITQWIDIVPIMPCRKGTVVKIMTGVEMRSVGKILHMYYDTGTAIVEQIGTGEEIKCMIGDLEEINLNDQREDDYSLLHNNFFDFLNSLIKLFDHNFISEIIFDYKVNYYETRENEYCLDYTAGEDFMITEPLRVNLSEKSNSTTTHSTVKIDSSHNENVVFECTCNDFSNARNNSEKKAICTHLIVILIDAGINSDLFSHSWGADTNPLNYWLNVLRS